MLYTVQGNLIIFTFKVNLLNFERDHFLINPCRTHLHHSLVSKCQFVFVSRSFLSWLVSTLWAVWARTEIWRNVRLEHLKIKEVSCWRMSTHFHQIFIRGLCPLNGVLWCGGCTAHPSQRFQAAQAVDEVVIFLKECGRLFSVRVNNWLRQGGAFHISSPDRQSLPLSLCLCWVCAPLVHSSAERPAWLSKLIFCLPLIAVRLHLDPGCFQWF